MLKLCCDNVEPLLQHLSVLDIRAGDSLSSEIVLTAITVEKDQGGLISNRLT